MISLHISFPTCLQYSQYVYHFVSLHPFLLVCIIPSMSATLQSSWTSCFWWEFWGPPPTSSNTRPALFQKHIEISMIDHSGNEVKIIINWTVKWSNDIHWMLSQFSLSKYWKWNCYALKFKWIFYEHWMEAFIDFRRCDCS